MVGLGVLVHHAQNALPDVAADPWLRAGEMLEQNLRRALSISNGNLAILWQSGVTKTLLVLAIAVLVVPPLLRLVA